MKRQDTNWEKYFQTAYPRKYLYLEYIKQYPNSIIKNKPTKNIVRKCVKYFNRHFTKWDIHMATMYMKYVQHHYPLGKRKLNDNQIFVFSYQYG